MEVLSNSVETGPRNDGFVSVGRRVVGELMVVEGLKSDSHEDKFLQLSVGRESMSSGSDYSNTVYPLKSRR